MLGSIHKWNDIIHFKGELGVSKKWFWVIKGEVRFVFVNIQKNLIVQGTTNNVSFNPEATSLVQRGGVA